MPALDARPRAATMVLLAALALGACAPSSAKDEAAIQALMRQTWDRPDAKLEAGPIAVDGGSAVADWSQGPMGGRALLKRRRDHWVVVLCAGDLIRNEAGLTQVGLPTPAAKRLAAKLAKAEAAVPPARLALMASFKGIVPVTDGTPQ